MNYGTASCGTSGMISVCPKSISSTKRIQILMNRLAKTQQELEYETFGASKTMLALIENLYSKRDEVSPETVGQFVDEINKALFRIGISRPRRTKAEIERIKTDKEKNRRARKILGFGDRGKLTEMQQAKMNAFLQGFQVREENEVLSA